MTVFVFNFKCVWVFADFYYYYSSKYAMLKCIISNSLFISLLKYHRFVSLILLGFFFRYVLNTNVTLPHTKEINRIVFQPSVSSKNVPLAITTSNDCQFKVWVLKDDECYGKKYAMLSCYSQLLLVIMQCLLLFKF